MPLLIVVMIVGLAIIGWLFYRCRKIKRTISIGVVFNPKGDGTMADLNLQIGQSSTGTVNPLLADGTINTTATLSNVVWTISDPSITATPNGDTISIVGVAASSADVTGTVSATATDSDGVATDFTKTFTVNVGTVTPPAGRTVGLGVTFTTPA